MNRTKRVNIPYIPEEYTTNYKADLSLSLHFCRRVLKDVLGNKLNSTCCYSFSRIMNEWNYQQKHSTMFTPRFWIWIQPGESVEWQWCVNGEMERTKEVSQLHVFPCNSATKSHMRAVGPQVRSRPVNLKTFCRIPSLFPYQICSISYSAFSYSMTTALNMVRPPMRSVKVRYNNATVTHTKTTPLHIEPCLSPFVTLLCLEKKPWPLTQSWICTICCSTFGNLQWSN